jgi:hypothetical protein
LKDDVEVNRDEIIQSAQLRIYLIGRFYKKQIYFLSDNIYRTISVTSFFDNCGCGVIGICPQTPAPPFITLPLSLEITAGVFWYFFAISTKAGPTSFVFIAWQALQSLFAIKALPALALIPVFFSASGVFVTTVLAVVVLAGVSFFSAAAGAVTSWPPPSKRTQSTIAYISVGGINLGKHKI